MTPPPPIASTSHLVLIPSYNPGPLLARTVRQALAQWRPVWVVSDGSTDGSDAALAALDARLLTLPRNAGKGAAILHALRHAQSEGFTHALVMDADDQHPPGEIPPFMAASRANPQAMILGTPVFGPDAPPIRVAGRRIANACTRLAAPRTTIGDALFGFRVYPIRPLLAAFAATGWMRRFDFDPEAAIRLARMGVPALNRPAPVRYRRAEQGGVSHFRYGRDNLLLAWMFARLLLRPSSAAPPAPSP